MVISGDTAWSVRYTELSQAKQYTLRLPAPSSFTTSIWMLNASLCNLWLLQMGVPKGCYRLHFQRPPVSRPRERCPVARAPDSVRLSLFPYILSLLSPYFLFSVLCVPLLDFGRLTLPATKVFGDTGGSPRLGPDGGWRERRLGRVDHWGGGVLQLVYTAAVRASLLGRARRCLHQPATGRRGARVGGGPLQRRHSG